MNNNVFISHSSKDNEIAERLYDYLKANDINPWMDTHDIRPGVPYAKDITHGINQCSLMIIIFSESANFSEDVINEIDQAHRAKIPLLPFLIDGTKMNDEMSYYLSRKQWIFGYPEPDRKFTVLLNAIRQFLYGQLKNADQKCVIGNQENFTQKFPAKDIRNSRSLKFLNSHKKGSMVSFTIFAVLCLLCIPVSKFFLDEPKSVLRNNFPEYKEGNGMCRSSNPHLKTLPQKAPSSIDLGLSSGTCWASMNVGAECESDYGDLFSWGEISIKDNYGQAQYGKKIPNNIIGNTHDVATMTFGKDWQIPSAEQFDELMSQCIWTWTEQNGHKGYKIIGSNGNMLFLPASGWICSSTIEYRNRYGYYWTGTSVNKIYAKGILFSETMKKIGNGYLYYGRCVRPVRSLSK
jgi:hypothetical protein